MNMDLMPLPVKCPGCGTQIGKEIIVQGIVLVHAGGGIWRELRGYCVQCGKPFYWSVKDKQMQTVIKGMSISRKKISPLEQDEPGDG